MPEHRPDIQQLEAVVESLRQQLSSLNEAMQLRALIEQAKGVLMGRESLSAEAAFVRLRQISQAENARLVDVAAALVGMTLPESEGMDVEDDVLPPRLRPTAATSPQWLELRDAPAVRRGVAGAVFDVLADNVASGTEAAQLVHDFVAPLGVSAVALWRIHADASLEQVGQVGYPGDIASAWRRVPLSLDLPVTRAAAQGSPVFVGSDAQLREQFPLMDGAQSGNQALAAVPISNGTGHVGVVGLSWRDRQPFDGDQRRRVVDLVSRVGRVLLRELPYGDLDWDYFVEMLSLTDDPWLVLRATDDGVAGLVVEGASADQKDAEELVGHRLLALYPGLVANQELTQGLQRLLCHGGRFVLVTGAEQTTAPWDLVPSRLRVSRIGTRVVIAWRADDPVAAGWG